MLLSLSTKLKESGTEWFENLSKTGSNTKIKKVDKFDCGDLIIDKMGLSGISFFCSFESPYNLERCEPIGLVNTMNSMKFKKLLYITNCTLQYY